MKAQWYAKVTSSHQGLVIDETTGRTVAVAYDDKDTDLLAAAPELLEALNALYDTVLGGNPIPFESTTMMAAIRAIAKAKGE